MDILLHAGKKAIVFCMGVRRRQQTNKIEAGENRRHKKRLRIFSPIRVLYARFHLKNKRQLMLSGYITICLLRVLEKVREKTTKKSTSYYIMTMLRRTPRKDDVFLTTVKVKLVIHPASSPDLEPCDFFIFLKIKDLIRGLTFTGPAEAVIAFNQHVKNMPSDQ
ncbi:hypothetical protein EVAR_18342_1 [Eumeta japonica]|uniref:Uncharacterized protein n=1 Tax=Eumeta variegata TaxID=151549 RepID=A0A4C1VAA7_EUMVA|nr:hypothetical protein EVAR_18342_1 [Eumeta japonica]